ncbi:MAG: hypothetical protein K6U74_16480 [Firmicutes bacterium]|nr:hypothetical protein [Bacillota bacterium]
MMAKKRVEDGGDLLLGPVAVGAFLAKTGKQTTATLLIATLTLLVSIAGLIVSIIAFNKSNNSAGYTTTLQQSIQQSEGKPIQ